MSSAKAVAFEGPGKSTGASSRTVRRLSSPAATLPVAEQSLSTANAAAIPSSARGGPRGSRAQTGLVVSSSPVASSLAALPSARSCGDFTWPVPSPNELGAEDEHFHYCTVCEGAQSKLVLCDGCPRVFHLKCIGIKSLTRWYNFYCPVCASLGSTYDGALSVKRKGGRKSRLEAAATDHVTASSATPSTGIAEVGNKNKFGVLSASAATAVNSRSAEPTVTAASNVEAVAASAAIVEAAAAAATRLLDDTEARTVLGWKRRRATSAIDGTALDGEGADSCSPHLLPLAEPASSLDAAANGEDEKLSGSAAASEADAAAASAGPYRLLALCLQPPASLLPTLKTADTAAEASKAATHAAGAGSDVAADGAADEDAASEAALRARGLTEYITHIAPRLLLHDRDRLLGLAAAAPPEELHRSVLTAQAQPPPTMIDRGGASDDVAAVEPPLPSPRGHPLHVTKVLAESRWRALVACDRERERTTGGGRARTGGGQPPRREAAAAAAVSASGMAPTLDSTLSASAPEIVPAYAAAAAPHEFARTSSYFGRQTPTLPAWVETATGLPSEATQESMLILQPSQPSLPLPPPAPSPPPASASRSALMAGAVSGTTASFAGSAERAILLAVPAVSEDGNEMLCSACGLGGDIVCCDSCPASYHAECEPELRRHGLPPGDVRCDACHARLRVATALANALSRLPARLGRWPRWTVF